MRQEISVNRLVLPLKQSAGTPCIPTVKLGDRVTAGQVIGEPAPKALGAILHAPISGVVSAANDKHIVLEK